MLMLEQQLDLGSEVVGSCGAASYHVSKFKLTQHISAEFFFQKCAKEPEVFRKATFNTLGSESDLR